jgi:hypothetical protein
VIEGLVCSRGIDMANDYDNLPIETKVVKLIVGFCPALVTWEITGSVWYAVAVFFIGLVAGIAVSNWYTAYLSRGAQRDAEGKMSAEDLRRVLSQSLPVFLWAPAASGILAAASVKKVASQKKLSGPSTE